MLKAVTNKDFPMLKDALSRLFGIELEHDPSLEALKRLTIKEIIRSMISPPDAQGRIRIIFIDGTEDLAGGRYQGTDIIGFNMKRKKLIFIGVPTEVGPISEECPFRPRTVEAYLLAVTFHELYENLTGDVSHCDNPGRCINSVCKFYDNGNCCVCMAGLIDEKYPDITLEDLYCEEDLALLKKELKK